MISKIFSERSRTPLLLRALALGDVSSTSARRPVRSRAIDEFTSAEISEQTGVERVMSSAELAERQNRKADNNNNILSLYDIK